MVKMLLAVALLFQAAGITTDEVLQRQHALAQPQVDALSVSVGVDITAHSSLVIDVASGAVLWSEQADDVVSIASITKLITALTLLDYGMKWDEVVTMQSSDQRAEGGNRHVYLGESFVVRDLFTIALVASDNEAIAALIRAHGLSEAEFVARANQWLDSQGLEHTTMIEPTGLDARNVSTAHEVARLVQLAFANQDLRDVVQIDTGLVEVYDSSRVVKVVNTNQLLDSPFAVIAGKTGFTDEAGYCLATLATVDDQHEVITVVLGADSITDRFQDTKALLYWVSKNYTWVD